jgi:glycosyltransferase involved in cell wall biosynthesis
MQRFKLAIIIPALNEAATIAEIVSEASLFGQVIVVDDGSEDGTSNIAACAGAKVINHKKNKGYDAALETGFREAAQLEMDAVITLDADGEHGPSFLKEFAKSLETVPLVLGVRPAKQRIFEVIMGWYFNWRFGVKDILCGMKGYQIQLYKENKGFDHTQSVGTELTLKSIKQGHPFHQIPVNGNPRQDKPRFDIRAKGEWQILMALIRTIGLDLGNKPTNRQKT